MSHAENAVLKPGKSVAARSVRERGEEIAMTDHDANDSVPSDAVEKEPKSLLRRLLPLILIMGLAGLIWAMGWHHYLSFEHLALNRQALAAYVSEHYVLALAAYFMIYAGVVALSLPVATFLTIFGGVLFGAYVGGAITVLAATAGAVLIYFIARTALGEPLAERAGPWLERLREGFKDHALNYLLFLRLVPLFPFWLVNIAPALLGVGTPTYVIGTLVGIIPGTFAIAFLGAGLDNVLTGPTEEYQACLAQNPQNGQDVCHFSFDPGSLITKELLIAFVLLGIVALIPVIWKKFKRTGET